MQLASRASARYRGRAPQAASPAPPASKVGEPTGAENQRRALQSHLLAERAQRYLLLCTPAHRGEPGVKGSSRVVARRGLLFISALPIFLFLFFFFVPTFHSPLIVALPASPQIFRCCARTRARAFMWHVSLSARTVAHGILYGAQFAFLFLFPRLLCAPPFLPLRITASSIVGIVRAAA